MLCRFCELSRAVGGADYCFSCAPWNQSREFCINCAVVEVELLGGLCAACEHQIVDMLAEAYAENVALTNALY